jgi:beta-lactamase superfamily II metal-dependent hydrolase
MVQNFAINVDFAVMREDGSKRRTLLAWGDPVRMTKRTASRIDVEVDDWISQDDGTIKPVARKGFLKRKAGGREVALPADQVDVLKIVFVDVQQGDGAVIWTPRGRLITIDGGDNQLFARFLAARFPGSTDQKRQEIDAMVVTHGDADHFSGLTKIRESETQAGLPAHKRLFAHPQRVYHNGLVKRPSSVAELDSFGATVKSGDDVIVTDLASDLLAVPAAQMNAPFKAWRKALQAWSTSDPIQFRRLAKGDADAFAFLGDEGIGVEVLGPVPVTVGGQDGLPFLRKPKDGVPLTHLDFQPGALSASHTINGHSIVLRLTFGNVRMLFAGDLNNASEAALAAEHAAGTVDLRSEILKVPHHGSHEFTAEFLDAVAPLVSVVSSGDENARKEYIHPRATLMNSLGRHSRSDKGLVFVTEMVAFFEVVGPSQSKPTGNAKPADFFGFRRSAFGCVRVRTDGRHLLVFTDSGRRDFHEVYAYDVDAQGEVTPRVEVMAK